MTEVPGTKRKLSRPGKMAVAVAAFFLLLLAAIYLLAPSIINTPYVANKLSRVLTMKLQRPVTVKGVRLFGRTLIIYGLSIGPPPGFSGRPVCRLRSVEITPLWLDLAAGRKRFSSIALSGLDVSLEKDAGGRWNFDGLSHLFKGKTDGGEITAASLSMDDSRFSVAGRRFEGISFRLADFSSKGSRRSRFLLSFADEYGSPFRIAGDCRLGQEMEAKVDLAVPSLSFKGVGGKRLPIDKESGRANLQLAMSLHGGRVEIDGKAGFDRLTWLVKGQRLPLSGSLALTARYIIKEDVAVVDGLVFDLGEMIRFDAKGTVSGVRSGRPSYEFTVAHSGADIANLFHTLPPKLRGDLRASGRVSPGTMRIKGDSTSTIASAAMAISMHDLDVQKGKHEIITGVAGDAHLDCGKGAWTLSGRLFQKGAGASSLLELRRLPFNVQFGNGNHPVAANIPEFDLSIASLPLQGKLSYSGGDSGSFSATVEAKGAQLVDIVRFLGLKGVVVERGEFDAKLVASGGGKEGVKGEIKAGLRKIRAHRGGHRLTLDGVSVSADMGMHGKVPEIEGRLGMSEGKLDGKEFSATTSFHLNSELFTLKNLEAKVDGASLSVDEARIKKAGKLGFPGNDALPLELSISSVSVSRNGTAVDRASAKVAARYHSDGKAVWLNGSGTVEIPHLSYRGNDIGSMAIGLSLSRGNAKAFLKGRVVDGTLAGMVSADPFSLGEGGDFLLNLTGASLARAKGFLPRGYAVTPTSGSVDFHAAGRFNDSKEIACTLGIGGRDVALADGKGRSLLRQGSFTVGGRVSGGKLFIDQGIGDVAGEPRVELQGVINSVSSSERDGRLSLKMPRVGLSLLLDRFANILPPTLQEANASGSLSASAEIGIKGRAVTATGRLNMEGAAVEIPSQKLTVAGISGAVPFDINLSGRDSGRPVALEGLTRVNYSMIFKRLKEEAAGAHDFSIERISFGAVEFAPSSFSIAGRDGITDIRTFESGLFHGLIIGRGFFSYQGGIRYGADILVQDISLRMLCDSYPGIKGYISGKVDGLISIVNQGKGINELKGYMDLWTRETDDERMLVSKEFLQKLAGKKFKGMFFRSDRPYDRGEISAYLDGGYLTFNTLDISHTNFIGMKDLSVSVAKVQNMISIKHLLASIREAASRGKKAVGGAGDGAAEPAPPAAEFKWDE